MTDKILFITGADSGIGKAVALLFAQEGADVAIVYLNEHQDANDTKKKLKNMAGNACLIRVISRVKIFAKKPSIKQFQNLDG